MPLVSHPVTLLTSTTAPPPYTQHAAGFKPIPCFATLDITDPIVSRLVDTLKMPFASKMKLMNIITLMKWLIVNKDRKGDRPFRHSLNRLLYTINEFKIAYPALGLGALIKEIMLHSRLRFQSALPVRTGGKQTATNEVARTTVRAQQQALALQTIQQPARTNTPTVAQCLNATQSMSTPVTAANATHSNSTSTSPSTPDHPPSSRTATSSVVPNSFPSSTLTTSTISSPSTTPRPTYASIASSATPTSPSSYPGTRPTAQLRPLNPHAAAVQAMTVAHGDRQAKKHAKQERMHYAREVRAGFKASMLADADADANAMEVDVNVDMNVEEEFVVSGGRGGRRVNC